MTDVEKIRKKYEVLALVMDERMTRLWAAAEAEALGWGGVAAVTEATGILSKRIAAGKRDLKELRENPPTEAPREARDYLGIGYHGLMALVRRGVVHTNQVTDFAPWRIARAELDSETVQSLVATLKHTGKLPPEGGSPHAQPKLFANKSTTTRKDAL